MDDFKNGIKIFFKLALKYYLKFITKLVLFKHKPLIIGVTGSINLVFVKDEIKRQLNQAGFEVRSNPKNFNTEIGLPLAILNLPAGYNSYKNWLPIIWLACKSIFSEKFPKILVLALGVAAPGDMKYLMSLARPQIGVITDITQRYINSFDNMDELVGEYEVFVKSIKENGFLILNHDNERIKQLATIKTDNITYFGSSASSDENYWQWQVQNTASGQIVKIKHGAESSEHELNRFGQHHIHALASGLIVKKIISGILK